MPTVHFMGYVEPRETLINIENLAPVRERVIDDQEIVMYTVAVLDSVVSVECEMEELREEKVSQLYTRAVELARTAVNLISIKMGWGVQVHIDTFIHSDGKEERLMNRDDQLRDVVDAYHLNDINDVFQSVACDVNTHMAINDMIYALSYPRATAVSCARVIDSIKNLIAPNLDDKAGWRKLHETLNVDEAYCQHISKMSNTSRHGNHHYLPSEEAEELHQRTWKLFNRYLHYRFHFRQRLPLDQFPQLPSAPTSVS